MKTEEEKEEWFDKIEDQLADLEIEHSRKINEEVFQPMSDQELQEYIQMKKELEIYKEKNGMLTNEYVLIDSFGNAIYEQNLRISLKKALEERKHRKNK